jgi:spore coat polysaccharide biosynthesis protein SpsF
MDFSIIIQARMGSTRLPSKTMMKIKNKSLLDYVYNQVSHSKNISKIIIATTTLSEDDIIVNYANSKNILVFRGDSENVLDRFYQCAKKFHLKNIVRITADNPLIDPIIIDSCIAEFDKNDYDYVSNTISKKNNAWQYDLNRFPYGMAVESFSFNSLEKAWKNAKLKSEKEHVTPYIIKNHDYFHLGFIKNNDDYSNIRLTVDHKEDFELIKHLIENVAFNKFFKISDIIKYLKNNHDGLIELNSKFIFNEGYLKSVQNE